MVCSNLRRAIQTGCIALWPRLLKTRNKIHVHNALQEGTRNVDTNSLLSNGQFPDTAIIESCCPEFEANKYLDVTSNKVGNKGRKRRAYESMEEFAGWCFQRDEDIII